MSADEPPKTEDTADLNQDDIPTEGTDLEEGVGELPSQVGHFRILRKIGEGGMGAVYEAEQDRPRRRVALKAIRPESTTPEIIKRFEQELQVLGKLHHPGIAEIYEAGTVETAQGARPYYAMEYIDGDTLSTYAQTHDLSTRQRLALMAKICDAVQHAHQRGVIHRDLKPSNILVEDTESSTDDLRTGSSSSIAAEEVGQPKILDFGVARATGLDLQVTLKTDLGQIIGTVPYMSPEQIGADPDQIDTRSDVYALGVIAFELLAGHLPYQVWRKPIQEAARIIAEEEPSRLRTVNRQYRGDVETIVGKALEKEKERRYQSAEDMASDIRRFLAEQPILARPPSATYQLKKFARRNRGLVAGIIAAFLILIVGTVVSTWQAVRAARGERLAAQEAETAKQVSDFMIELFEVADPYRSQGTEITARELLDNAVDRIEDELSEQPEVQARMMSTLGAIYQRLGIFEPSQRLLESALTTRRQILGDEHPDTLSTLDDLATVLNAQGRLDEAEPLYRQAIATSRRVLGNSHRTTLQMVSNLCTVARQQGKLDEAEELCREAVDGLRELGGIDDRDAIVALQILGAVHVDQARLAEAELCFREALAASRRILGDDHPHTLHAISGMSYLLKEQGKIAEAEPYYREALETRRRVLGDDHPSTLTSLTNMGLYLKQQGRFDEAETHYRQALEGCRRVLGDDHDETLVAINNLGVLLKTQGRFDEAEPLYRDAVSGYRRRFGDDHPRTLLATRNLGILRKEQGRFEEADQLLTQALDGGRRALGEDHPSVAVTMNALGELAVARDDLVKAESIFQDSLVKVEAALGPAHPTLARILRNLARVHARQSRYDASAACFDRAISILEQVRGEDDPMVEEMREERTQVLGG